LGSINAWRREVIGRFSDALPARADRFTVGNG
jgi:hypothetical protein